MRNGAATVSVAPRSVRVLVIDRQPLFLDAMSRLLATAPLQAQVVVTRSSQEAVTILQAAPVDLVVCDVRAEPVPGPELPALLAEHNLEARVVLLADTEDMPLLVASLLCGASGFFTKDAPVEEFLGGLNAVLQGNCAVGQNLLQPVSARLASRAAGAPRDEDRQLSPAEHDILVMVGQAQSIRTIAEARGISHETVRNHLASIYRKLGLHNRTEAILWAARMGLIHPATGSRD
jgi:DNA-binding NarL/FixJ family response regulator